MALSNMLREPRREITETVAGIVCVAAIGAPFIWGVITLANIMQASDRDPMSSWEFYLGLSFGIIILGGFIAAVFLLITHSLGEWACARLDNLGLRLRPKQRY